MTIPNRNWLLRTRRSMCGNYQDLCNISQVDRDRLASGVGQAFDIGQRKKLDKAIKTLSKAIDHVNELVKYPRGS